MSKEGVPQGGHINATPDIVKKYYQRREPHWLLPLFTYSPTEVRKLRKKPRNYLALQRAYEGIVSGSVETKRETGVTFLTNQKDLIVPVFAVTGTQTSVEFPMYDHFELLDTLPEKSLNTFVFFHNHLLVISYSGNYRDPDAPIFSEQDIDTNIVLSAYAATNVSKIETYFAVGNSRNRYKWWGIPDALHPKSV